jgi:tetratricopeptide (TPR) repeat protein
MLNKIIALTILVLSNFIYSQEKVTMEAFAGIVRDSKENPEAALATIEQLKKSVTVKDSLYTYLYFMSADINMKQDNFDALIDDFTTIIRLEPSHEKECRRGIAQVSRYFDDYTTYINSYERIIKLDPNDEIAYESLANAYNDLKQYDKAIRILNANPNEKRFEIDYYQYARAYYGLGNPKKALENITLYFESEDVKENYSAWKTFALIYKALGKAEKSCESITMAGNIIKDTDAKSFLNSLSQKKINTPIYKRRIAELSEIEDLQKTLCK